MRIRYYGIPVPDGWPIVRYVDEDLPRARPSELPEREDLVMHADRFTWGWVRGPQGGATKALPSGASQLALALCAHALADDRRAVKLHLPFGHRIVGDWPITEAWSITAEEVCATCDQIEQAQKEYAKSITRAADRAVAESDRGMLSVPGALGPVQWHTDENGNPIPTAEDE